MKRERMLQVALVLVGLVYVAMIYPLYTDLAADSGATFWQLGLCSRYVPVGRVFGVLYVSRNQ